MTRRLLIVLIAAAAAIFLAQFGTVATIAGMAILTFCVIGAVASREEREHDHHH